MQQTIPLRFLQHADRFHPVARVVTLFQFLQADGRAVVHIDFDDLAFGVIADGDFFAIRHVAGRENFDVLKLNFVFLTEREALGRSGALLKVTHGLTMSSTAMPL